LWQKYQEFAGKRAIIFALEGQMGAGKTQFVKGLAKTMGIREEITSPSYDLLSDYRLQTADYRLIHIDTWRMLKASEETKSLKFERLIGDKSVIAIEWADRVSELIRSYSEDAIIVWVKISYGKSETERLIIWGNL